MSSNIYELVICVFACDTIDKYKEQILKINKTWGALAKTYSNIKLLYFLGEEKTDLIGHEYINLPNVKNDYLSASHKQTLGLKYIKEHLDTKFVICCGTDTYLNIPKLMSFLKKYDYNENLYIGGHGCVRKINGKEFKFHSGGAGFILTKTSLDKVYPYLENMVEDWYKICDSNNSELHSGCDVMISYYLQLPEVNVTYIDIQDGSFRFCTHRGSPCHLFKYNQDNVISCHNMTINDFERFTLYLKHNNYCM